MRDLKNVIFFDDLLQESYNALVRQAKEEGKYALGYTCYFMPEVLLDLPGCFSVRLRAPRCTSPDMATYYMSSRVCHYARSLLERALEGGYNFIDAQLGTETCAGTCRFQEHLAELPDLIQNEKFFVSFTDVPFKKNENSIEHFAATLQKHVLDELHNISASTRPTKLCAPRLRRTTRFATSSRRSANFASSISPRSPARSSTSSISSRWSVQSI